VKNNTVIFAKPPSNNISLEDCEWFHIMDIPGLSEPTKGSFDLRKGVNDVLGNVDFKDKTVLHLGPSTGFLTFAAEKKGGDVTGIDLDINNRVKGPLDISNRDVIPRVDHNWQEEVNALMMRERKQRNAFWYAHKALNSKSKLILSHVNELPANIGMYDISLIFSVLVHIRDPFLALQKMLSHTKEKIIITELGGHGRNKSLRKMVRNLFRKIMSPPPTPSMTFLPNEKKGPFGWWKFSPEIIINMAKILGFGKTSVNYHTQLDRNGNLVYFYTVVCERTVPIENCNYGYEPLSGNFNLYDPTNELKKKLSY